MPVSNTVLPAEGRKWEYPMKIWAVVLLVVLGLTTEAQAQSEQRTGSTLAGAERRALS